MKTRQPSENSKASWAAMAALALVLTLLALWRTDLLTESHSHFGVDGPHRQFVEMANGGEISSPVGLPVLVRALPLDVQTGFVLLAVLCVWISGVAIFYLCRSVGFSSRLSFIGLLLFFTMGWAVQAPLGRFWCPDAAAGLSIALVMLFTLRGQMVLAGAALLVGAAFSGTALFAAPLLFTLRADGFSDLKSLARGGLAVIPAFVVWFALRSVFPPEALDDLWVRIERSAWQRWNEFDADPLATALRHTLIPFGAAFGFLPLFGLRQCAVLAVRVSPLIAVVYASLLIGDETERSLALLFPVVIPLALFGVQALRDLLGVKAWALVALPGVLILLGLIDPLHPVVSFQIQTIILLVWLALIFGWGRLTPPADCPTLSSNQSSE